MDGLDEHVVAPARLKLMTTLSAVSQAEFATVRDALEVSDSVLSKHLAALEEAGYVRRRKGVRAARRGPTARGRTRQRARRRAAALIANVEKRKQGRPPGPAHDVGRAHGPRPHGAQRARRRAARADRERRVRR